MISVSAILVMIVTVVTIATLPQDTGADIGDSITGIATTIGDGISSVVSNVNNKKKVLILANLGLGDAMNFLSVADKYRKAYPKEEFEITLWVSNHLDELMRMETEFDKVELVPFNQITTDIKKRIALIKKIREYKYDVVIDVMGATGCTPSMYLMASSIANEKITIINKAYSICPKFFTKKIKM